MATTSGQGIISAGLVRDHDRPSGASADRHRPRLGSLNGWGEVLFVLVTTGLGLVFAGSGAVKMYDPAKFLGAVYEYGIVAPPWGRAVAISLPAIELVCGVALLARFLVRGALAVVAGMLAVFVVAQAFVIARGMVVSCGCFGDGSETVGWLSLGRTAGMAVAAGWAIWWSARRGREGPIAVPLLRVPPGT